jgi:hypothetical protein
MKVGFDIHGVLDTFEVFQNMITKYIISTKRELFFRAFPLRMPLNLWKS